MQVNLELVNQVVELIPEDAWSLVKSTIIDLFLSYMTTDILQKLTGKPDDFDTAERILIDYYEPDSSRHDLITHAFQILGTEETIDVINGLELAK